MGAARLKEIAQELREMHQFGKSERIDTYVNLEASKEFDLGEFGYRETSIEFEDYEISLDAEEILDKYPIETDDFDSLADELEEFEVTLDDVLAQMEDTQPGLVTAVKNAITKFKSVFTSEGPLPLKPLPWPGALKPEIDYTAKDFPLRFQPPPGFDWYNVSYSQGVPPEQAVSVIANVKPNGVMVLDSLGRVQYEAKDGQDPFTDGRRWKVWHIPRDGIPSATGFSTPTEERALDEFGNVIPQPGRQLEKPSNWDVGTQKALARVREIREQFEASLTPTADPELNEWGVTYDPRTIELQGNSIRTLTEELRVGDYVSSYGRVLTVERRGDGSFYCTFSLNGELRDDVRRSFDWNGQRIVGWEDQPTALSIWEAKQPVPSVTGDYDPKTVAVGDEITMKTTELRRGDDFTGDDFGRVLSVTFDGGAYTITMDRDGKTNTERVTIDDTWSILPVVGVDRESLPAAVSADVDEDQVVIITPDYDPLTVPVLETTTRIIRDELRLGDDITGGSFGRLVGIADGRLQMDRDGTRNTYDAGYDGEWQVRPIDVPDRAAIPTAVSLFPDQVPVPAPAF
jgi:hypothetical protein